MTADASDERRDALHAMLQELGCHGQEGALLTGWALVTQWADADGEPWLSCAHSATVTSWGAKGLWHEALYGDWSSEDDGAP